MAVKKIDFSKMPAQEVRKKAAELQETLLTYEDTAYCPMCGLHKDRKSKFYLDKDPMLVDEACSRICRECARRIALRVDENGEAHAPTKESVMMALRYLNKPFLDSAWNASVQESDRVITGKPKNNPWSAYVKNIQMKNYDGKTFFDSDFYKRTIIYDDERTIENSITDIDVLNEFEQNKKDTIRLLGYDPFEKESPLDKPFLYSNLIGYLDSSENANEDRMKVSSIIEIVKGFNHAEKLNNAIANMVSDVYNIERNVGTIKSLEDTKNKIMSSIINLAKDNGISLKHSVNASKGENTWTGKVRKMKEMGLREAETNLYNIEYSNGLSQVADISNASIIKQIRLDENDYNDMIIQQRELINKYKKMADDNEEKARLLLRENYDLKEALEKNKNSGSVGS